MSDEKQKSLTRRVEILMVVFFLLSPHSLNSVSLKINSENILTVNIVEFSEGSVVI